MFLLFEDEYGPINLLVSKDVYARHRQLARDHQLRHQEEVQSTQALAAARVRSLESQQTMLDASAELAQAYVDSPKGQPPVPPARLALATILQAYAGVSDDEVIEAMVMDRRWQLVLDCMDADAPPFAKGTLVGFRKRLIECSLDRRLIERTVALAARTGWFGARALRAARDSSALGGRPG